MKKENEAFTFSDSKIRRALRRAFRWLLGLCMEIEIDFPERNHPREALIYAANHVSGYDGIILQLVIEKPLCFMSKAELFRNPVIGWVLNKLGSFPVRRGEFDRQAILNARRVLQAGYSLLMFPEGTRTFGKGMVEARSGTAHLAMRNRCPIQPLAIIGAETILKNGWHKGKVIVSFCELINPKENETAQEITTRMMLAIAEQLPETLRGVYG